MNKFPAQYCIATKDIENGSMLEDLLLSLQTEGYKLGEDSKNFNKYKDWMYIGVNEWGSIFLFSDPWAYLAVDREPFANILTKSWLIKYLYEPRTL